MKPPTPASLKKVTRENLARLGAERLAEILVAAADTKPELKRRLRMELAAEQGPEHLIPEIERRLGSLAKSRSRISWRQRPTFIRDVDALRALIVDRLAPLEAGAGLAYLLEFLALARTLAGRMTDKHGDLGRVFATAAIDLGKLLHGADPNEAAARIGEALRRQPNNWSIWAPSVLSEAPPTFAASLLAQMRSGGGAPPDLTRQIADAAGDLEAFAATFTPAQLKTPSAAAQLASRLLSAGRLDEAGRLLIAAGPKSGKGQAGAAPDFEWETVWIDYLEQSGQGAAAQDVRWESFLRTLSPHRARAFIARLADFDDVEAEERAFAHARAQADALRGLSFLMAWPALVEAAALIEARGDEVDLSADQAQAWAEPLRSRHPAAAARLLRRGAAGAFRRRDYKTSDRLTAEADRLAD